MSIKKAFIQQLSDVFAYVLIPGLAVLLPAAFSRMILRQASRWRWLMAAPADLVYRGAQAHINIADEAAWKSRWKQVELLDVRDLYLMMSGRSRSVLAEIDCSSPVEIAKDRVMIGMHWGPSISILKLLQTAGLKPALPYRPPERQVLRQRPCFYLYSIIATRYMVKTLGERAIPVGGAGAKLRAMMDQPGSVFVVMDAPPMAGRQTINGLVLGRSASFNAGFPKILADKGKEYVFYAMHLYPDGSVRKKLELDGPHRADNAEAFLQRYAQHMDRHLLADSSHWRIWHVAPQLWRDDPHPPTASDAFGHQES